MTTSEQFYIEQQLEPDILITGNYKSFYPVDKQRPIVAVCPPESEPKCYGRRFDDESEFDNE
jgi:hypothetical protein